MVIVIGFISSKKIKNIKDFSLGGRKLSSFIIVASSVATAAGAGTCLGQAGKAYTDGFSALWLVIAWVIGMLCLAFISERVYNTNAQSLSGVFGNIHGRGAARLCGVYTMVYSFGMLIVQMMGMGTVLHLILRDLNVSYEIAVIIGGLITILYTLQGGFIAVAYTDTIQVIILSVGMVVIFPLVTMSGIAEQSLDLVFAPKTFNLFGNISILGLLAIIFKYTFSACTGIPYIQRILASKDAPSARKSQMKASFGYLALGSVIMITAIFARLLYPNIENPDIIVVNMILEKFPVVLAGLGIAALISAVMSSVDSYLLVASQIFTQDIYSVLDKKMSDKKELLVCKIATVIFGLVALLAALKFKQILVVYEFAATIYSSAIFFPFILSLYCKFINKYGVIAGMLSGSVVSFVMSFIQMPANMDSVILGNIISLCFTLVVSHFTRTKANKTMVA